MAELTQSEQDEMTAILTQIEDDGLAILFTFIDDESSVMEANITDNYVETNHTEQDHIAIRPRIYRLRGCVGEVVYKGSTEWLESLTKKINSNPVFKKTLEALKPINAISGIVSNATQAAINIVNQLESSYNRYREMIENNFSNSNQRQLLGKRQETTVAYLNRILEQRIPVKLTKLKFEKTLNAQSPDEPQIERKYYLQSVSAHQGNNDFITDIEVTIKEFRIASKKVTTLDKKYSVQVATTKSEEKNKGGANTEPIPGGPLELATNGWKKANEISAVQEKTPWQFIQSKYNVLRAQMGFKDYYKTTYKKALPSGSSGSGGTSW